MSEQDQSLEIRIRLDGAHVAKVEVHSRRPLEYAQILMGRSPEEAIRLIEKFFPLTRAAHLHAAVQALEEASGIHAPAHHAKARTLLVHLENIAEPAERLSQDWAQTLGRSLPEGDWQRLKEQARKALYPTGEPFSLTLRHVQPEPEAFARIVQTAELGLTDLLGLDPSTWASQTPEVLAVWLEDSKSLAAQYFRWLGQLPDLVEVPIEPLEWHSTQNWNQFFTDLLAAELIYLPEWAGQCRQTGAYARQARSLMLKDFKSTNPLKRHCLAQLLDLCFQFRALKKGLEIPVTSPGSPKHAGLGLAQTEGSRGRIVHRIELERGLVKRYQIQAPTEWNFHPQGLYASTLRGAPAEKIAVLAQHWAKLVDPFVLPKFQIR